VPPAITILQLDTGFPRVPGDVACPDSYLCDLQIVRVKAATVQQVVSRHPEAIPITPFEDALKTAKGDVIATSCGFLSYWQTHLATQTPKPFISSALTALDRLSQLYKPDELLILTFDAAQLKPAHLGNHLQYASQIVGLPPDMHLVHTIRENAPSLDVQRAGLEIVDFVMQKLRPSHRHILLECTNLPPYKAALRAATGLDTTDILTEIEAARPGTVRPNFL
jgi:hypothetical protein